MRSPLLKSNYPWKNITSIRKYFPYYHSIKKLAYTCRQDRIRGHAQHRAGKSCSVSSISSPRRLLLILHLRSCRGHYCVKSPLKKSVRTRRGNLQESEVGRARDSAQCRTSAPRFQRFSREFPALRSREPDDRSTRSCVRSLADGSGTIDGAHFNIRIGNPFASMQARWKNARD